jgi:hypothetical protein
MAEITVIRSNKVSSTPGLPRLYRDSILSADDAGEILFIGDMGFSWSYDQTSPVPNNAVVKNTANTNNGSFIVNESGPAPVVGGGGIGFGSVTSSSHFLQAPVSVTEAIIANNNNMFQVAYFKLPLEANWPATSQNVTQLVNWCVGGLTQAGEADVCSFEMRVSGATKQLVAKWPNGIGLTGTTVALAVAGVYGQVAQLAAWRNDAGCNASIRVGATRTTAVQGTRVVNSASIVGCRARAGILPCWGALGTQSRLQAANDLRLYRLVLGTPKPGSGWPSMTAFLDADWAAHASRFS